MIGPLFCNRPLSNPQNELPVLDIYIGLYIQQRSILILFHRGFGLFGPAAGAYIYNVKFSRRRDLIRILDYDNECPTYSLIWTLAKRPYIRTIS